jgi:hypothetical protein
MRMLGFFSVQFDDVEVTYVTWHLMRITWHLPFNVDALSYHLLMAYWENWRKSSTLEGYFWLGVRLSPLFYVDLGV